MAENSHDEVSRSKYFTLAVIAEQAGCYDMVDFMEKFTRVATSSGDLTHEEHILFSLANKGLTNVHRNARKVASSALQKEEARAALVWAFRARVEADIAAVCTRVIEFIDSILMPSVDGPEATAEGCKGEGFYEETRRLSEDTAEKR